MAVYNCSSARRLPKRWTQWKAMFLTMSSRSFRWVWIKSLTVVSRSSFTFSDIPENIKLSLMLQAWSLMTVSLIFFYFLPRVREFTVSLRLAFSAARTPRTYTVPENLNGGFPGGPDVHQSCTVFYLWMLKYPQCCSWLWWVFEVALFQGQCSCAAEGSRHLVTLFSHNNMLEALVNILPQTVQVFFAVLQSGEVG